MRIRKIQNTALLLLCSLAIFAQSVEIPVRSANKRLLNEFERVEVSPTQLEAFEVRGAQKLNDLAEYLEYISDETINDTFRTQAKQLALDLFVASDVPFKYYDEGQIVDTTIEKYLAHLLKQKDEKTKFEFLNITKISDVEKATDGSYTWSVQFVEKRQRGKKLSFGLVVVLEVSLQKVAKKFGSETKWIWEVLLGEMLEMEVGP